jgi:hypothetical protein
MITYELLAKLRLENNSLLSRMDQLRHRVEAEGTSALTYEVSMLRSQLHDYVCLVDALVDALVPDAPEPERVAHGR